MTGWDEHGFAVKTGLPIDRYLGSGDLQDAENCGYAPTSVLAELGVDESRGPALDQYRDGYITLLDGTWLSRGGTLNCVWAVTRPPRRRHDPGELMEEPDHGKPEEAPKLITGSGMKRQPGRETVALYCDECGELTCEHRCPVHSRDLPCRTCAAGKSEDGGTDA